MQLHTIRLMGIGPCFPHEVTLDVDAIDGDFIVIAGDNGEGKSTLLEAFAAAVDPNRMTPTHGSLSSLAESGGKDAFVEVSFTHAGHRYLIRHDVGRDKAYVYEDGAHAYPDAGGVRRFGEWARQSMLPPDVFTSSIFLPQRSEGLVSAEPGTRRKALLHCIGVEELEGMAARARAHARDLKRDIEAARAVAARDVEEAACIGDVEAKIAEAVSRLAEIDARVDALTSEIDDAKDTIARSHARDVERALVMAARSGAVGRVDSAVRAVRDIEDRIAELDEDISSANDGERSTRSSSALRDELAQAQAVAAGLDADERAALRRRNELEQAMKAHELAIAKLNADAGATKHRLAVIREEADHMDALVLPAHGHYDLSPSRMGVALEQMMADVDALSAQLEEAKATRLSSAEDRIDGLRSTLIVVVDADELSRAKEVAQQGLRRDDAAVSESSHANSVEMLECALDENRSRLAVLGRRVDLERRIIDAEVVARGAADALHVAIEDITEERLRVAAARSELAAVKARALDVAGRISELKLEIIEATAHEERRARLDAAVGARDEALATLKSARAALALAESELAAMPTVPDPIQRPDLRPQEEEVERLRSERSSISATKARQDEVLVRAVVARQRVEERHHRIREIETEHDDAMLLASVLGVGGAQALEIDAAGPALTANFNALLHGCFGARWTGEVRPSRPSKNAKKDIEECVILVHDTLRGRSADASAYSGGERVHLSTAFSLALSWYLCKSRGVHAPTLILDEPGAGLSQGSVGPWVEMVRIAAREIGASKTIVVTHNQHIIDAADAVVRIQSGEIAVM